MTAAVSSFGDVMVVGGGMSGIQAALDLATSGYKVYLVEKDPTIGGKMAQLDKTFPTNDCSMCIESPKFIECDRHPNIEILTYTEVDTVEGEARNCRTTRRRTSTSRRPFRWSPTSMLSASTSRMGNAPSARASVRMRRSIYVRRRKRRS